MIVFCIIPISLLWGQGSSILPNKHTHSCSPQNSHLVHINQMERNKMWRAVSQCVPERRGRWRPRKQQCRLTFHWSMKGKWNPCWLWVSEHLSSPVSQFISKNTHMHIFWGGRPSLLFGLLTRNITLELAGPETLIKTGFFCGIPDARGSFHLKQGDFFSLFIL